ncbi:DUF3310 domain-containing protein [Fusobacterium perfoetens]|uniref:DUF3310 domain-containing protein n=1 Tax=Fusobacterium perfoetens TaxID=852 RepID=UPI001F32A62C|nr:DUF3310 domain-containing protein [Fusobacterium perfoetens]
MLNEDSKKILVTMSEMIFYQEKEISELKFYKENLIAHLNQKKELLEEKNNELKRRVLETNSLNEKIKTLEEELQQKDNSSKLRKELKEKDNVNSPNHYKLEGLDIESIDVIFAVVRGIKNGVIADCVGNILKYVMRAEKKNGLEDYKKARKYLDWCIEEKGKENKNE